jgi:gamma-butyrobetaine dioxygenase
MSGERSPIAARLARDGWYVEPAGTLDPSGVASPWIFAERLLGEPPRMVERQIIKPIPAGRSFASSDGEAPLHNDMQRFLGAPPDLQILVCVRAASTGGSSLLLDTWPLVGALKREDPKLFDALFTVERRFPFVAGDVRSPTVARFGDRVAFVHTPKNLPDDPLAAAVSAWVARHAPREVTLRAGEILVVDNHRVLHGRTTFADPNRELQRLLVWLRAPREVPTEIADAARRAPRAPNATTMIDPALEDDLALVARMLGGASPGALATRMKEPEPRLYALRDAAVMAALEALRARRG